MRSELFAVRRRRRDQAMSSSTSSAAASDQWFTSSRKVLVALLTVTAVMSVALQIRSTTSGGISFNMHSSSELFAVVTNTGAQEEPAEEALPTVDPALLQTAPWFDPRTRYFFYQPSGGISNQLLIMESALLICRRLRRTCLIPPIAPHTSGWWNYNSVGLADVLPVNHVLDTAHLQRVAPVIPLQNHTLKSFLRVYEDRLGTWRRLNKCAQCTIHKIQSTLSKEPAQVLFFGRTSMWQWGKLAKGYQFPPADTQLVENELRVHKDLRRIARQLSSPMVPYLSMHIRFLDGRDDPRANFDRNANRGAYWKFPLRKPAYFIQELENAMVMTPEFAPPKPAKGMKPVKQGKPLLFIATSPKERSSQFFREFKRQFNATFAGWVEEAPSMKQYMYEHNVPTKLASTVLGIVEQLICARSTVFMGTSYSSFSASIRRMRRYRETVADETVSRSTERGILEPVTRCDNRMKAC